MRYRELATSFGLGADGGTLHKGIAENLPENIHVLSKTRPRT